MFNYKQLYYFRQVANSGGITRAAEHLHLTPQTISGQVSELERSLGSKLFRRSGRRLELTEAGKLALAHADEIFQLGKELEGLLRGDQDSGDLVLRVGVADVVPKSIAYRLLAPALELQESVRLICHEDKLERLFAELAIHKLDLVIADRALPSDLGVKGYSHALGQCAIDFHATPALAARYRDGFPQSLQGAPLLIPSSGAALRGPLLRWLDAQQIQPRIVGEFDDAALMKAFGQAGAGVFPVPAAISDEVQNQYHVDKIGSTDKVIVKYFAISVERRLTHPAVVAVCQAAQRAMFVGAGARQNYIQRG